MDVEIAPEPNETERAVLAAFAVGDDEAAAELRSPWARAALEEGIGADDEGYGSAPSL